MVLLVTQQEEEEEERGKLQGGMKATNASSLLGQSPGGRRRL